MSRTPPVPLKAVLLNTPDIEVWPAGLLRARGNRDARLLSQSRWVMRRKRDGMYLAAGAGTCWHGLQPAWRRQPGVADALRTMAHEGARSAPRPHAALPMQRLQQRLDALGLDAAQYAQRSGLALVAEPAVLDLAGLDRYRRALWLRRDAARAWRGMQAVALRDGIVLEAISGYRSHDYQLGIFERKRARGLSVAEILQVNAAPGFSEHHSGLALDLGAPDEPPAEESFEATPAFAWLRDNAGTHGFCMSYPRDNPHGIVYEPWHWRYAASGV